MTSRARCMHGAGQVSMHGARSMDAWMDLGRISPIPPHVCMQVQPVHTHAYAVVRYVRTTEGLITPRPSNPHVHCMYRRSRAHTSPMHTWIYAVLTIRMQLQTASISPCTYWSAPGPVPARHAHAYMHWPPISSSVKSAMYIAMDQSATARQWHQPGARM